jgi:hypothetical protein
MVLDKGGRMEYFVVANSFAAPFFSDTSTKFVEGETPADAMERFVGAYKHPCGLFAAVMYESADAYHKNGKPLLKWICNHELKRMEVTKDKGAYTIRSDGPGSFVVDGVTYTVKNPKSGKVVATDTAQR